MKTSQLTPSKLLWELNLECDQDSGLQRTLASGVLKKIVRFSKDQYLVSDGKNSLQLSAFILLNILNGNVSLENERISGLTNFVVQNAYGASIGDISLVLQVGTKLNQLGVRFPVLRSKTIFLDEGVSLVY